MANQLVWFRNDLRTCDHAPLSEALVAAHQQNSTITAAFIWSPEQLQQQGAGSPKLAAYQQALDALNDDLAALGVELQIITAPSWQQGVTDLIELCVRLDVDNIYCHYEPGWDERLRDGQFHDQAPEQMHLHRANDLYSAPPRQLLTLQGNFYKVFTPYKRNLLAQIIDTLVAPRPAPDNGLPAQAAKPLALGERFVWDNPMQLPVLEQQAHERLEDFMDQMNDYSSLRDIPARAGTSLLSTSLALGTLSSRQVLWTIAQRQALTSSNAFLSEILWREFYKYLLAWRPELCLGKAFNAKWDQFPWQTDPSLLQRWQAGQTGVPLVDAAARQLNQTGWMHNRLRMVSAMYLVKILQVDWRHGEAWFARQLADFDFAANNGGWQWVASTGVDATPYFRIFNPHEQSRRFDPDGDFIRKYVPELAPLANKAIHQPTPELALALGYPLPVVDYKTSRADTLVKFKKLGQDYDQHH
ncbi:MAG: DNA photolyase family protein [Reinekea forsetii]|nr:DNA photolyase family protein [Reinekea forsetii]